MYLVICVLVESENSLIVHIIRWLILAFQHSGILREEYVDLTERGRERRKREIGREERNRKKRDRWNRKREKEGGGRGGRAREIEKAEPLRKLFLTLEQKIRQNVATKNFFAASSRMIVR